MSYLNIEEPVYESASDLSKKKTRNLYIFWIGLIIYTINYIIPTIVGYTTYSFPTKLQLVGLLLMVFSSATVIRNKIQNTNLRFFYFLYCTWLFITILRGFEYLLDMDYFMNFFFNPYEGLLYFAPLVLLFPINFKSYRILFNIITLSGIIYIALAVVFYKYLIIIDLSNRDSLDAVESLSILSFPCGFILLTFSYHSKKRQFLAIIITLLALVLTIFRARRGLTFMYSTMILFSVILYLFGTKAKIFLVIFTIFMSLITLTYVLNTNLSKTSLFKSFMYRIEDDSRKYPEDCFFADLKQVDWIIGKGLNGKYYCPGVEENIDFRGLIETGYLTTILKGGLVSIALFLIIAVPAVIKGLFQSKNSLTKAGAIWILMSQLFSYPGNTNAFVLTYLIVWISIAICYSKEIRSMTDETVLKFLYPKKNDK